MLRFSCLPTLAVAATLAAPGFTQAVDYAALEATVGEPVTTSVTGKPQRVSETPASIVIITRDQIVRSTARDVPGLLKTYAGIYVNRWTAGQSDVAVRGGVRTYNARLLVLVNGRQVYLDHYGMTNWNLLGVQLEEIQQIELVRGPSAALFGFNAATGVVNIITTDAQRGAHLTASGSFGNHGYSRLGFAATIPVSANIGMRISAGRQREDERLIPADQFQVPLPRVKRDEVDASIVATPDARTRLTLDAGHSENVELEYLSTQTPLTVAFDVETAGLRGDRDTEWGSLTARVYHNRLAADYLVNDLHSRLTTQTTVAQTSGLVRFGLNNVVRFGAEYRTNNMYSADAYSRRTGYDVMSASAMVDLHPASSVAVTLAARADRVALNQKGTPAEPVVNRPADFHRSFTRVSLNAALLFQVGEDGQLRINGGRGYQLPSLINYGFHITLPAEAPLPFPLVIAGDPRINPSPVWSGEIGYNRPLGWGVSFDGTAFFTRSTKVIASPGFRPLVQLVSISQPALVARFAGSGSFETYGVEMSLKGKLGNLLDWRANYTFIHSGQPFDPEQYIFAPRNTTPQHVANAELSYKRSAFFTTAALRYMSSTEQFFTSPAGTIGLYHLKPSLAWDQKIGFRLSRDTVLTLAGENLTKAGGAAGSQIPADRRIRATAIFSI